MVSDLKTGAALTSANVNDGREGVCCTLGDGWPRPHVTEGRRVSLRQPPRLVARRAQPTRKVVPQRLDDAPNIAGWERAEAAAARVADIKIEAVRAAARSPTGE